MSQVCAGISILTFNTINAIEAFTDEDIEYECPEDYMQEGCEDNLLNMYLPQIANGSENHDVQLLMSALVLGMEGIRDMYPDELRIIDNEAIENEAIENEAIDNEV